MLRSHPGARCSVKRIDQRGVLLSRVERGLGRLSVVIFDLVALHPRVEFRAVVGDQGSDGVVCVLALVSLLDRRHGGVFGLDLFGVWFDVEAAFEEQHV